MGIHVISAYSFTNPLIRQSANIQKHDIRHSLKSEILTGHVVLPSGTARLCPSRVEECILVTYYTSDEVSLKLGDEHV